MERQHAGVLTKARTSCLALLLVECLETRHHHREQLEDDRGGDVRAYTEHHDREIRKAAAGEEVQEAEELVVIEKELELVRVDARDRDSSKHTKDGEYAKDEQETIS